MGKIAVITGKKADLQDFIEHWYHDEKEMPEIEEGMEITIPIKEEHIEDFKGWLCFFDLKCHIEIEK